MDFLSPSPARREAERRPPARPVVMYQQWRYLLFLHWRWDAAELAATLPPGLHLDTFGGSGWLGVVPFWMDRVRPRFSPPVPGISWFQELNLRTYVHDDSGRPGVWFYSLDCNQAWAVRLARALFSLPYVHARQSGRRARIRGDVASSPVGAAEFHSERRDPTARRDRSAFEYAGEGPSEEAEPGSLEFFLIERYVLFARHRRGHLLHGRVWHPPYRLQRAEVRRAETGLFGANGFVAPRRAPDHARVSPGVDVSIFPLLPV